MSFRSAARAAAAGFAVLAWLASAPAGAEPREVRVPIRLDSGFVALLADAQLFRGPDRTLRLVGPDDCSVAVFSAPVVSLEPGFVRLVSRVEARAGLGLGGRCVTLATWRGELAVDEEPILDAPDAAVRFRVVRSELRASGRSLWPERLWPERIWQWIEPAVIPHLAELRIELAPALDDVRRVLPLFARPADADAARRLAASLALAAVRADAGALTVDVRLEVDAPPGPAAPEPALDAGELAAVERSLRRFDAFVTFVVKQAGRDALDPALRRELLELLLDARHDLVAALATPSPAGEDAVRGVFRRTWARLAPLLRQVDGAVPLDGALRYLSFVAAGDALAAVDAAAPAFGLQLSSDGLRRLARTLAPAAAGDPLDEEEGVDPELREIFGFGPPLPAPEPPPEPDAAPTSQRAPWLERVLSALFVAPAYAAPAEATPLDPDRAALARRLNRWSPGRDDIASYRPLAGRLLRDIAEDVHGASGLGATRGELFRSLALAAAWQESCWRQYVERNGKLVPLRSATGDVGVMQVNERVWRGFYALQGLRWDVAYNARAGDEILLHYLSDFALPREPRASAVELARASYAMYNGGPGAARRWRDASAPPADAGFAAKLDAIRAGREADVERCYTG